MGSPSSRQSHTDGAQEWPTAARRNGSRPSSSSAPGARRTRQRSSACLPSRTCEGSPPATSETASRAVLAAVSATRARVRVANRPRRATSRRGARRGRDVGVAGSSRRCGLASLPRRCMRPRAPRAAPARQRGPTRGRAPRRRTRALTLIPGVASVRLGTEDRVRVRASARRRAPAIPRWRSADGGSTRAGAWRGRSRPRPRACG